MPPLLRKEKTMGKVAQYGDTYWGKDADKDSMKGVASQGRKYAAYDTGKLYVYDEADDEWIEWGGGSNE